MQAASPTSVRGAHPQRLRRDEDDEMKLRILDAALGQPVARRGVASQTVIASTHHYARGPVTELRHRIATGELDARVYTWCYRESLHRQLDDGSWVG